MGPAGARQALLGVGHAGLGHDLEPRSVVEGQEVGAEVRVLVVVAVVGDGAEEADEEVPCSLEIVDVECDVLDSHGFPLSDRCSGSA